MLPPLREGKYDKKGRPNKGRISVDPTLPIGPPGIQPVGPGVRLPDARIQPVGPPQLGPGSLPGILPVGPPQLGPTGIPGVPAAPQNSGALQSILGLLGLNNGGGGVVPGPAPMPGLQANPVLQLIQAMKNRRYSDGRI